MSAKAISSFEDLAHRVASHPLLDVLDFRTNAPINEGDVREAEARWKTVMPSPILDFYRSADGLSLSWRFKPDLPKEMKDRVKQQLTALTPVPEDVFSVAGSIHLLSLREALLEDEYALPEAGAAESTFDLAGETLSDEDLTRMLRPFDPFDEYYCMAFVVQPDVTNWKVMLLADHWIQYWGSTVTWFEDYLEFLVTTWGIIGARQAFFRDPLGNRRPPVRFDTKLVSRIVPPILLGT
jgi:hypothetical protein